MKNAILQGDALIKLKELPEKSINMCMTSPPYWALRDYGTAKWEGGDENCNHKKGDGTPESRAKSTIGYAESQGHNLESWGDYCRKCGAKRIDKQVGLEPTFDSYVNDLCDIFDEVNRVLKDDGTCWVNLGDTYYGSSSYSNEGRAGFNSKDGNTSEWKRQFGKGKCLTCGKPCGTQFCNRTCLNKQGNDFRSQNRQLKDKCLTMIPMRFAIEMVNRGWILRNTIIWHKPNAMPSSVKDRFTVDFEYLFFFSKKKKYYFRTQYEPMITNDVSSPRGSKGVLGSLNSGRRVPYSVQPRTREFVKYRDLPDIRIFSEHINNVRKQAKKTIDEVEEHFKNQAPHHWFNAESFPSAEDYGKLKRFLLLDDRFDNQMTRVYQKSSEKTSSPKGRNKRTVWSICPKPFKEAHFAVYPEKLCETPIRAGCPVGGNVLDPFFGAGTTGLVALKQNKNFIGIELNPEYIEIAKKRLKPFIEQATLNLNNTTEKNG